MKGEDAGNRIRQLLKDYWEAANERGPHLEEFVRSAAAGERGAPVSPEDLRGFLEAVREILIDNIETKARAGGPWALMKDDVIAETHAEIDDLIQRYGGAVSP